MRLAWILFKSYLFSKRSGSLVKIIAWHSILASGIGVAALIVVLSVMSGFNLTIRNRMLASDPHLVILDNEPTAEKADELKLKISRTAPSGLLRIDRFETQDFILRAVDGVFSGTVARGLPAEALTDLQERLHPKSGSTVMLGAQEILLGVDLARSLGVFEGDEVLLIPPENLLLPKGEIPRFDKYIVKALLSTQMPELDSKMLLYRIDPRSKRQKALSRQSGYEVRLNNAYESEKVKTALTAQGFNVQTWGERDTSLLFALKMESLAMTLFLSLAVIITSFSIVILLILLLTQKSKDLGLMMAMGLSPGTTRLVFMQIGLYLSSVGVFGGAAIAALGCLFLEAYPLELLPDVYTDATLPVKLSWSILLSVMGGSALIGILGSWLPVARYVGNDPAAQLRRRF